MEKPAKAVNVRRHKHISTFPVWVVFLCMLPGILHYTIFRLFPSVMTAVLSFTDISGIPGSSWQWVGWANYKEFFVLQNIRDLKASLGRTGIYALSVTLIQNAIALLMAVILNGKFLKGRNFARAVYFMPVILGAAVVSTMCWALKTRPRFFRATLMPSPPSSRRRSGRTWGIRWSFSWQRCKIFPPTFTKRLISMVQTNGRFSGASRCL